MGPPKFGKPVSMILPLVCILFIGALVVPLISATFYVEVHNENAKNGGGKLTLYTCELAQDDMSVIPSSPKKRFRTSKSPVTPSTGTKKDDLVCNEVSGNAKNDIYAIANFYVILNPELEGGSKIHIMKKGYDIGEVIERGMNWHMQYVYYHEEGCNSQHWVSYWVTGKAWEKPRQAENLYVDPPEPRDPKCRLNDVNTTPEPLHKDLDPDRRNFAYVKTSKGKYSTWSPEFVSS